MDGLYLKHANHCLYIKIFIMFHVQISGPRSCIEEGKGWVVALI